MQIEKSNSLRLSTIEEWQRSFFEHFLTMEKQIFAKKTDHLFGSIGDYRKKFRPEAPFNKKYHWRAIIVYSGAPIDDEDPVIEIEAVAIISVSKKSRDFASLGHIYFKNSPPAFNLLMDEARQFCRNHKVTEIRTPMNGNFFDHYRIKSEGATEEVLYFNEPDHPEYIHGILKTAGFSTCHHWQTLLFKTEDLRETFHKAPKSELKVRNLKKGQWIHELQVIHRLLHQSFAQMPDFQSMDFSEFLVLYEPLKVIVDPKLIWFVEDQGIEQGFLVAIRDPLPVLLDYQNKTKFYYKIPVISEFMLLRNLKRTFHNQRLIVLYLGKNPQCKTPGITAQIGQLVIQSSAHAKCKEMLIAYVSMDSPVRKTLPPKFKVIRDYVLYKMQTK